MGGREYPPTVTQMTYRMIESTEKSSRSRPRVRKSARGFVVSSAERTGLRTGFYQGSHD